MGSARVQGQLWDAAAHDWAELQEPMATPLWQAMLGAAAVGPGTHFLDAGCGAGGACVLAAQQGALVNGLDASAALLDIARQRVPDGDFANGDLEALPYANGIFDAVIAADVLSYARDPANALHELRRVCTRSGRLVIATWGQREACDQHAIVAAVCALLPAPLHGEWDHVWGALSAPGALEVLAGRIGLRVIGSATVACACDYPDLETAWLAQVSAGPLQAVQRVVGKTYLKAVVQEALAPFRTSTGDVRLVNHFRYLTTMPSDSVGAEEGAATPGTGERRRADVSSTDATR
jgi:SAM-dependent methyltransferase